MTLREITESMTKWLKMASRLKPWQMEALKALDSNELGPCDEPADVIAKLPHPPQKIVGFIKQLNIWGWMDGEWLTPAGMCVMALLQEQEPV